MKKNIRKNNPGLRFLLQFWQKHCTLEDWHIVWARQHIQVITATRKDEPLYHEGDRQKHVYIVAKGMLARTDHDTTTGKRRILSIALPAMALMTTAHLYSNSPANGDIIILRPGTVVIQLSYPSLKEFKTLEPHIATLIDILINKKKKQLEVLRHITHGVKPFDRVIRLSDTLPDLYHLLEEKEIADLLDVSRYTVQSAKYYLLTGKLRRNKLA